MEPLSQMTAEASKFKCEGEAGRPETQGSAAVPVGGQSAGGIAFLLRHLSLFSLRPSTN